MAKLLDLPPLEAGVVVLFAAMPTGANAYIFAVQYQRLVDPVSGAIALATLLAAVTLRATLRIMGRLAQRPVGPVLRIRCGPPGGTGPSWFTRLKLKAAARKCRSRSARANPGRPDSGT
jgi:hypothetical protein